MPSSEHLNSSLRDRGGPPCAELGFRTPRTRLGLRQRLNRVQDIIALNDKGLMPPEMPARFLLREIWRMQDVTETLRCTVAGVTPPAGG